MAEIFSLTFVVWLAWYLAPLLFLVVAMLVIFVIAFGYALYLDVRRLLTRAWRRVHG